MLLYSFLMAIEITIKNKKAVYEWSSKLPIAGP